MATRKTKKVGRVWFKRFAYLSLMAIPAILIFKNKAALVTAAAIAYDKLSDVGHELADQAEVVIDRVKDMA